ncbi:MAG: hypothetical protein EAZ57_09680 [Cytophagales bacterium]|nr:MAG: hypothetical protein EAZ67_01290 [Cytophagales bacterium]TAF59908.1 MAG: hypothetical protein EAZ57_09680 [Cytophagales bacterium]
MLPANFHKQLVEEGFCYLDMPLTLKQQIVRLFDLTADFFEMPQAQKSKISWVDVMTGYRSIGIEYSATPDNPDLNESFSYKNVEEKRVFVDNFLYAREFLNQVKTVYLEMDKIATEVIVHLAKQYTDNARHIHTDLHSWLQLNSYRPHMHQREFLQDEHEDGHIVTIITANQKGLELRGNKGYHNVKGSLDELVVMPGELLSLLTGNDIMPLHHRVRNHSDVKLRMAMMYFCNPNTNEGPLMPWVENDTNKGVDIIARATSNPSRYGLPVL